MYNTSPQFPVTVNHQLLRYFAAEFVVVEVMQARGADFNLVGRAQVPLYDLLGGKTRVQYSALPIRGNDGKALGTLRVRALQPLTTHHAAYNLALSSAILLHVCTRPAG